MSEIDAAKAEANPIVSKLRSAVVLLEHKAVIEDLTVERDKLKAELKTMTAMWKALSDKLGEVRADNGWLREALAVTVAQIAWAKEQIPQNPTLAQSELFCVYGEVLNVARAALKPNEPETKTVAVPAGQGYEAPIAGIAEMKGKP